jgi:hypothetical protein
MRVMLGLLLLMLLLLWMVLLLLRMLLLLLLRVALIGVVPMVLRFGMCPCSRHGGL